MPNAVTPTGLQTTTQPEYVAIFTAAMQAIYGADINLDPDSPDGQMMYIFIQTVIDTLDTLTQVYNSFDPDNAVGVVLDQRVAINGIQRQAGTFTITNVTVTVSQALTLFGLDQSTQTAFTVADNAGNNFQLLTTTNLATPGAYVLAFQAQNPGAILTVPNTITVPVTIILGVTSVNNPTTYSVLGINEETDAALKIRRQKSVSLSSQGYLAGLLAALDNIALVSSAFVYENNTGTVDGDGIPGHSIWVIVGGNAADVDVATAIYKKRNAGCGMKGSKFYVITQVDGSPFVIKWDAVQEQDLFIKFTATSLDGVNPPNIAAIRAQLQTLFVPGVHEQVNITDLGTLVQDIDNNTLVTNAGFSTSVGGSYTPTLTPTTKRQQWGIASVRIIILPMILSPSSSNVQNGNTEQFTPLGGYGAYTYSFVTNNSGGTFDTMGLYTAGGTFPVTDTLMATDSLGNTATATVSVT